MRISDWSSDVCSSDLWTARLCSTTTRARARSTAASNTAVSASASGGSRGSGFSIPSEMTSPSAMPPQKEASSVRAARRLAWTSLRSEEHTSELQSLMRNSYAVFSLKKKTHRQRNKDTKYDQLL